MNKTEPKLITDEEFVIRHLNGDDSGFSALYKKYFIKVYYRCYSFTRDHNNALDLAQDILLKVYGKLDSFKGEARFSTWLFAITYNYCVEIYRKKKNIVFEQIGDKINISDYAYEEFPFMQETGEKDIDELMKEISDNDRLLLQMKYEQNLSIKDLQNSFHLSASAVKMRLQRARQRIEKNYLNRKLAATA